MQQEHNRLPPLPTYTMSGILNHLQIEWKRFEKDRNEWEIERSDLRVPFRMQQIYNLTLFLLLDTGQIDLSGRREKSHGYPQV